VLLLKRASASRPSGTWNEDDYDVLADGVVVGRIMKANAAPVGSPWLWTFGFNPLERRPTHGYTATREAAIGGVRQELAAVVRHSLSQVEWLRSPERLECCLARRPAQCHAPPRRQRWRHDGSRQAGGRKTGASPLGRNERVAVALFERAELSGDDCAALDLEGTVKKSTRRRLALFVVIARLLWV